MLSLSKYSSANESIYRIGVFMSQILSPRIIRLPELINRTGLGRSTIYQLINDGKLNRIKLGARSMGFLETEVNDWIASKVTGGLV